MTDNQRHNFITDKIREMQNFVDQARRTPNPIKKMELADDAFIALIDCLEAIEYQLARVTAGGRNAN